VVRAGARHRSYHLIGASPFTVQRVWVDLPSSTARRGTKARRSRCRRHDTERDGAEQRALRATRRQLGTNAREVLNDARADLGQELADGRKLRERVCPSTEPGS
jgi:hypothetical protein